MLEQRIEELRLVIAEAANGIKDTTERLIETIERLSVFQEPLQKRTRKPKEQAVVQETESITVEKTPDADRAPQITLEDVRQALLDVSQKYGRESAIAIIEKTASGKKTLGDIPPQNHAMTLKFCQEALCAVEPF